MLKPAPVGILSHNHAG